MPAGIKIIPGLQPEDHVHLMFEVLLDLIATTNAAGGSPLFSVAQFTTAYNNALASYAQLMTRQDRRMTYGG